MDIGRILASCDHTLLRQDAVWEEIRAVCDDGIRYHTASVCIPPSFVREARAYLDGKCGTDGAAPAQDGLKICTVIGFPNGYSTTAVKVFEAADAVANGADEIDMVINVGLVKAGNYDALEEEIRRIKEACGAHILKVILEICMLTDDEIVKVSECAVRAGADYVKTSTGFGGGGATFHAVELMKKTVGDRCKVKAAGGIRNLEDAEKFLALGADRLGTSRVVKAVKELEEKA